MAHAANELAVCSGGQVMAPAEHRSFNDIS